MNFTRLTGERREYIARRRRRAEIWTTALRGGGIGFCVAGVWRVVTGPVWQGVVWIALGCLYFVLGSAWNGNATSWRELEDDQ